MVIEHLSDADRAGGGFGQCMVPKFVKNIFFISQSEITGSLPAFAKIVLHMGRAVKRRNICMDSRSPGPGQWGKDAGTKGPMAPLFNAASAMPQHTRSFLILSNSFSIQLSKKKAKMEIVKWLLIYCFFGSIKVANAFNIGGYDTEIKNAGRFIASVLARPNGHGSIVQQCERLGLDLNSLLDGCRKSGNTASCRAWWHANRQEFAPKIGQFLIPSYVQYYSALKDLAGKCLQQRTRPSVMEELTPKFVHYFLGGHRNASASSSMMHGTNDVILFYHIIYSAGRQKLYHRAILVHNSVIHYVGQKGIYVETLEEYEKNVAKDGFKIESQPLGQQTRLTPEQIQIQLDSWVGTGHGHEFGMFAAGEFSRSDNNCHHFTMKLLDLLYSNNTSQGTRNFMEGLFNKGSPELRKAYDNKLKAEKAADNQKEMMATHLGGF